MPTVQVESLTGVALDWAVANVEGLPIRCNPMGFSEGNQRGYWIWDESRSGSPRYDLIGDNYSPSTNWSQGGPLMERYGLFPRNRTSEGRLDYAVSDPHFSVDGPTPLIAAMRAVVLSALGAELSVPQYLLSLGSD